MADHAEQMKRYQARMMVKEHGGIYNTLTSGKDYSVYSSLVVAQDPIVIPYINYTLPFSNLYEFLNSSWASMVTTNAWQSFNGAVNFVYWGLIDGLIDFALELGL